MPHVSSNISCDCATCVSNFILRHPRDFRSPTSRRGTLYTDSTTAVVHTRIYSSIPAKTPALGSVALSLWLLLLPLLLLLLLAIGMLSSAWQRAWFSWKTIQRAAAAVQLLRTTVAVQLLRAAVAGRIGNDSAKDQIYL